jgi:hypothetical protein
MKSVELNDDSPMSIYVGCRDSATPPAVHHLRHGRPASSTVFDSVHRPNWRSHCILTAAFAQIVHENDTTAAMHYTLHFTLRDTSFTYDPTNASR